MEATRKPLNVTFAGRRFLDVRSVRTVAISDSLTITTIVERSGRIRQFANDESLIEEVR